MYCKLCAFLCFLFLSVSCLADKRDSLRMAFYERLSDYYVLPTYDNWVKSLYNDDTMKMLRNLCIDNPSFYFYRDVPEWDVMRYDLGLSKYRPTDEEIEKRQMDRAFALYRSLKDYYYIPSFNYFMSFLIDVDVPDEDYLELERNNLSLISQLLHISENRLMCDLGIKQYLYNDSIISGVGIVSLVFSKRAQDFEVENFDSIFNVSSVHYNRKIINKPTKNNINKSIPWWLIIISALLICWVAIPILLPFIGIIQSVVGWIISLLRKKKNNQSR